MPEPGAAPRPTFPPVHPSTGWHPRVKQVAPGEASAESQEAYARYKSGAGPLHNGVLQLGSSPAAVDFELAVGKVFATIANLPPEVVAVARLRCAAVVGCEYCVAWHRRFVSRRGFTPEQIDLIADPDAHRFDSLDHAADVALRFADQFSRNGVGTPTWEDAKQCWGEAGAMELTLICAAQNASSRISRTLMTPFEGALTGER